MFDALFLSLSESAKTKKNFKKNEFIFRQHDSVDAIYFLQSGRVQLQRVLENGSIVVVHQAKKDESFAEASLFSEMYHCDALCVSDVSLLRISKRDLLAQMKCEPAFNLRFVELLSKQVQHYRQRLQIASIKSAEERILAALRSNLPFDKITDLAASISLTHEAAYRALSRLTKQGRITKTGRGQFILKN